ncbi:ROK family glucokinase [Brevibacillus massiliensis]|uniref:ROK family glucokinase n=2 Tax=Brevibacillus massiliensis TaxID=1118054 RepID=UPI0028FCB0D0|nr:ROK family glucokinase [Brevibacillus massiliensis]
MFILMQEIIAGVDVGGTSIKAALFTTEGNMIRKKTAATLAGAEAGSVIAQMRDLVEALLAETGIPKTKLLGIGAGIPGPVDPAAGRVLEAVNLGWKLTMLGDILEQLVNVPVYVENDANLAALGEMWLGAGRGAKDLVALTLGSGIGCGIILNGRIVGGASGGGGEIGHMTIEPSGGPACSCGRTGCLETFASATAIIREAERAARAGSSKILAATLLTQKKLTAKDVFAAVSARDESAIAVIDQASYYLGLACSHLAAILNPARIIFGGGVSQAGSELFDRVRHYFSRFAPAYAVCDILPAALGNDAGVIGGAWLVRSHLR